LKPVIACRTAGPAASVVVKEHHKGVSVPIVCRVLHDDGQVEIGLVIAHVEGRPTLFGRKVKVEVDAGSVRPFFCTQRPVRVGGEGHEGAQRERILCSAAAGAHCGGCYRHERQEGYQGEP